MYPSYPDQLPGTGGSRRPQGYPSRPPGMGGQRMGGPRRAPIPQGYSDQHSMRRNNIPRLNQIPVHTDANCDACFDMNTRLRPQQSEDTIFLGPNNIKVLLAKFLRASQYNNCPFCTILLELFAEFVDNAEEKIEQAAQLDIIIRGSTRALPNASVFLESGKPIEVHFREGRHATWVSYPPIQIYNLVDGPRSGWPGLATFQDPGQVPDANFRFFKNQIDNCINNHPRCAQTSVRSLPKRLLDLGTSDRDVVKLVESISVNRTQKYAAVSHRWCDKSVPMLVTTKNNYYKHTQGIASSEMPAVLNDSIRVTRNMGIRYLWMDTLCLIQDDDKDKEEELPKMGAYYTHAHFTIAASSSRDSRESFLKHRNDEYAPAKLQFGDDPNSIVSTRRTGVQGHLAKRGWIWQESALSTRLLNFAPSELIWECKSQVLSECGYEPRKAPSLGLARQFHDIEQRPFELWRELVDSYSDRQLTNYTDVLPAISGLAQRVKDITNSEYYAGLWGKNIVPSLLWEVTLVEIHESRPKVPAKYTAPSWSWASIQGKVRTSDLDMGGSSKHAGVTYRSGSAVVDTSYSALTPIAQVDQIECTVPLRNENPFGQVTGGSIDLTCPIVSVDLVYKKKSPSGWIYKLENPAFKSNSMAFSPDTELERFMTPYAQWTVRRSNQNPTEEYSVVVECLLIAKGPGETPRTVTMDGIVLARNETNSGQRVRIGFFSLANASSLWRSAENLTVTIV